MNKPPTTKKNEMPAGPKGPAVLFKKLFNFSKSEIDDAFKAATRVASTPFLTLLAAPSDLEYGKLTLISPRKVGKSHDRNLLRRRVKAIFYENELYKKPFKFILLARKGAIEIPFEELRDFLTKHICERII
ncbi:ribonuclease P protein component [Candidatus Dependentiae bacterium]